jgi:hypothetical protein
MSFIQNFYQIYSSGNEIFIIDIFENKKSQPIIIEITTNVKFVWGKLYDITNINLYDKNFKHLPTIIREVFREERSLDFFKFLINQKQIITIPLRDIKEEFPNLYGEKLRTIISKSIPKGEL